MWDRPRFLALPERQAKPRTTGLTHVLDKGGAPGETEQALSVTSEYVDIVKIGWGIGYVDPSLKERVAVYQRCGVLVTLGGTLLELAAQQGRVDELRRWAADVGVDGVEVSNGLCLLTPEEKRRLVTLLSQDFVVLAEVGTKSAARVTARDWLEEMATDLEAGARWTIAEGRESGTVGLYEPDGTVRVDLVEEIARSFGPDRVIFEAPRKHQQAWFVRRFGPDVNLGNIALDEVLPLETLRLGLRADTATASATP